MIFKRSSARRDSAPAHVWVRDSDVDVIGGEIAFRYAQLGGISASYR